MLNGKTIYLIEDNPTNLAIISAILRRNEANVRYDRWGVDTFKRLARSGRVDLIILDLMFPNGVSGYELFDQIKALPGFANTPIVAVSAADSQVEMPKAKARGFMGYISKPINNKVFPRQIAAVIAGKQVWEDSDLSMYNIDQEETYR